jgi:hypothetical protein
LAALTGVAWLVGLWRLGLYTHPAVRSWRRLAAMRGMADRRPVGERLAARLSIVQRVQQETDVGRLLAIAGRHEGPTAWLLRVAAEAGLALVAVLGLDEVALASGQAAPLTPGAGLVAAALLAVLAYLRLRHLASSRQQDLGRAVADSLPHLAVMTFHHRLPASEALLIFARCQRTPDLHELLTGENWRTPALTPRDQTQADTAEGGLGQSTALTYERIGQAYGVPMFTALGSALRRISERGLASQEVFTGLARMTYAQRLAEARVSAARAKTLIVIPMGLMVVPVLVLIGAPLVASLAGIFAR